MLEGYSLEQLLQRDEIMVDSDKQRPYFKNKVILITGAAGFIGSELARQCAVMSPAKLILLDQAETPLHELQLELAEDFPQVEIVYLIRNITDRERIFAVLENEKVAVVFHAAAYKHVPLMEHNPIEALRANVTGTKNVLDACVANGVGQFVLISTDKAVRPSSVMGVTKKLAELITLNMQENIKVSVMRFGNIIGSSGSVFPLFARQIAQEKSLTVTDAKMMRYFMTGREAVGLVLDATVMTRGGEVYIFDMGNPIKIMDLAQSMLQQAGKNLEIILLGVRKGEKYSKAFHEGEPLYPTGNPFIQYFTQFTPVEEATIQDVENLDDTTVTIFLNRFFKSKAYS